MADKTYTATGRIDVTNRSIILDLYLPPENPANRYEFNYNFNLSKLTIFNKKYNVIFCHLRLERDPGSKLDSQTKEYQLTLEIDKLIQSRFIGIDRFDFNLSETLFLLLHDDSRSEVLEDSEFFFTNIENIIERVNLSGNHNIQLPYETQTLRPRRLGMSIIKP